jgi:hypothetical protein
VQQTTLHALRVLGRLARSATTTLPDGIMADIYMIARGNKLPVLAVWIVIHSVVIVTGLLALRRSRSPQGAAATARTA